MTEKIIKIIKAAKDFNVGQSTLIEYLKKKNIEVDEDKGPNARISKETYDLLASAFKSDKDTKMQSDVLTERLKDKRQTAPKEESKPVVEEIKTVVEPIQRPKIVGKINIDSNGKAAPVQSTPAPKQPVEKENAPKPVQQPVKPVVETPKPEVKAPEVEKPVAPKPAETPKPVETPKPAAEPKPVVEVKKPVAEPKPVVEQKPAVEAPKPAEPEKKEEIFSLGTPTSNVNINVVGKFDLSAFNQSSRLKMKSKL